MIPLIPYLLFLSQNLAPRYTWPLGHCLYVYVYVFMYVHMYMYTYTQTHIMCMFIEYKCFVF